MCRIIFVWFLFLICVEAADKADKYHRALQRNPFSKQLLVKFFDTWELENEDANLAEYLIQITDNSWQNRLILAHYQIRVRQFKKALVHLDKAIELQPENYEIYYLRAELLLDELQLEKASKDLELVVKNTQDEMAHKAKTLLSKCYVRMKRIEEAVEIWEQAIAKSDDGIEFVETAESEGQIAEAAALCETLILKTKDPYSKTRYSLKLGKLKAKAGENDEALKVFVAALEKTGTGSWIESEILLQCDSVLRRAGNLQEEIAFYAKLEAEHPRRSVIIKKHATLLAHDDQWEQALKRFHNLIKANPTDLNLREELISFLENAEKREEALAEIDALIKLTGYKESLLVRKIELFKDQDKKAEIGAIIKVIAENLTAKQSDQIKLAKLQIDNEFKEQGEQLLKSLLINDENYEAHRNLAEYLVTEERDDEALALLMNVGTKADLNIFLQVLGPIEMIKDSEFVYHLLKQREAEFINEIEYLAVVCDYVYRADKYEEGVPLAIRLVKLSKGHLRLANSLRTAVVIISRSEKQDDVLKDIEEESSTQMLCLKAEIWAEKENLEMAEEILSQAIQQKHVVETYVWSDLLARNRKLKKSIDVLEGLKDTEQGKSPVYLRKLAYQQFAFKQRAAALKTIDKWKIVAPADKQAWLLENTIYINTKQHGKAIQSLRRAIAKFDDADEFELALGNQYLKANRALDAMDLYWKAYEHATTDTDKIKKVYRLISFGEKYKQLDVLEKRFLEKHEDNPKSIVHLTALANLYSVNGDLEKELNNIHKLLEFSRDRISHLLRAATIYEELGDLVMAESIIKNAIKEDEGGSAGSQLIRFYLRIGRSDEAVAWVERILEESSPREAQELAFYLYGQDYWEEAEGLLESVVRRYPNDARIRYIYASVLEDRGKYEEAMKHFIALYDIPEPPNDVFDADIDKQNGVKPVPVSIASYVYNGFSYPYKRNFSSRHTNKVISMPLFHSDLLALADVHIISLCQRLEIGEKVQNVLDKRHLGDPQQIFQLLTLASRRNSPNQEEIKTIVGTFPKSKIAYQVVNNFGVNLDIKAHAFALENYNESYLKKIAAYNLLQSSEQKYYQKGLKYFVDQIQQGVVIRDVAWYWLYTALVDDKAKRSEEEKKALKQIIIGAIDQYQKSDPGLLLRQSYVRDMLLHLRDERRLLLAIDTLVKPAVQSRRNNMMQWLMRPPQGGLTNAWMNSHRGYVRFNYSNTQENDSKIAFIEKIAQQVKDPVYKALFYIDLKQSDKAKSILRESIGVIKEKHDAVMLTTLMQLDDGDYEGVLKNIDKYQKLYNKQGDQYTTYCCLVLMAYVNVDEKIGKKYVRAIKESLVYAVHDPQASPWSGMQAVYIRIAKKIGDINLANIDPSKRRTIVPNTTTAVKKKIPENERLKKARSIMSVAQNTKRSDRISKYQESGKEKRAIDISVRLLKRYLASNDISSYKTTIEKIGELDLHEKVVDRFMLSQAHTESDFINTIIYLRDHAEADQLNQYIDQQFIFSTEDKNIIKDFLSMKDDLVFTKLIDGKHEELFKLLAEKSRDLWFHYNYNMCKIFVENPPEDKNRAYIQRFVGYGYLLQNGHYFRNGQRVEGVFQHKPKDPYKVEERGAMIKLVIEALFQMEHGAQAAYNWARNYKNKGFEIDGTTLDWAKQALLVGVLETNLKNIADLKKGMSDEPGVDQLFISPEQIKRNRSSYPSRYNSSFGYHHSASSHHYVSDKNTMYSVIYRAVRKDADTSFSLEYMEKLAKKSPRTHQFLSQILSLRDLKGEEFAKEKEQIEAKYTTNSHSSYDLLNQFMKYLDRLIPYTREKFETEMTKIKTDFKQIKDEIAMNHQNDHLLDMQKKVREVFARAIEELKPKDICESYFDLHLMEQEFRKSMDANSNYNNINIFGMNSLDYVVSGNDEFFKAVAAESWKHDLNLQNINNSFYGKFSKGKDRNANEVIKVLEECGYFYHGYVKSGKEYTPLLFNNGIYQYNVSYSLPSQIVNHFSLSSEEYKRLDYILRTKKRDTFSGAVVGALIIREDRDEAVEYLLNNYADKLLALDDTKLDMIFSYLNLNYPALLASEVEENKKFIFSKHQKIASARLKRTIKQWNEDYTIDTYDVWDAWRRKASTLITRARLVDVELSHTVSDKLLGSFMELIKDEKALNQSPFLTNQHRTYRDLVSSLVYELRNVSGVHALLTLKKMQQIESVTKIADFEKWQKSIISDSISRIEYSNGKYYKENGSLKIRSLQSWERLEALYTEFSKLPEDVREIIYEPLMLKYTSSTTWNSPEVVELVAGWRTMEVKNQLDDLVKTIAYLKDGKSRTEEELQDQFADQLVHYLAKYPHSDSTRNVLLVKSIASNTWTRTNAKLLNALHELDLEKPDVNRVTHRDREKIYNGIKFSNDDKVLEIGGKLIEHFMELVASEGIVDKKSLEQSRIEQYILELALKIEKYEVVDFIIGQATTTNRSLQLRKVVEKELNTLKKKGELSPTSQKYIEKYEKSATEYSKVKFTDLIERLKGGRFLYTDKKEFVNLRKEVTDVFRLTTLRHPEDLMPLLIEYETACDKFSEKCDTKLSTSSYHLDSHDRYCGATALLIDSRSAVNQIAAETRLRFYAEFLGSDRLKHNDYIKQRVLYDVHSLCRTMESRYKQEKTLKLGENYLIKYREGKDTKVQALIDIVLFDKLFSSRYFKAKAGELEFWESTKSGSYDFLIYANTVQSVGVSAEEQAATCEFIRKHLSNSMLSTGNKFNILDMVSDLDGWTAKSLEIQQLYFDTGLAYIRNGNNAFYNPASSVIEYSLENEQFEEQHGKKYLDAWYEQISKTPDRRIDTDLAKWIVIYTAKHRYADVLNWLLESKHKDLTGYAVLVSHLVKYQYFDEAKQLLPKKGKTWRSTSSFSIEYDARFQQSIDNMWVAWSDDPWSCALVDSTLLKHYKQLPKLDLAKHIDRIYQVTKSIDDVNYLSKDYILKNIYADPYYMHVDEELLNLYAKEASSEDTRASGHSKYDADKMKDYYHRVLARNAALRGDLSLIEELYEPFTDQKLAYQSKRDLAAFANWMNVFVIHLIVNEEDEILEKYHALVKKISIKQKKKAYEGREIDIHFMFTRLIYEMEKHQKLDYQRVFGDDYITYKSTIDSRIRSIVYRKIITGLKKSPVWMSPSNEKLRRKMVKKFLKYSDISLANKLFLSNKYTSHSDSQLLARIPGNRDDLYALAEDNSLKIEEKIFFKQLYFRYLVTESELDKAEPLYVELKKFYIENNQVLYGRIMAMFLNCCHEAGREDLWSKYAKGTKYFNRYTQLKQKKELLDLNTLTKEQIVKELKKIAIDDKGLVNIESLEEWLYNTQQYRHNLISVELIELEKPSKVLAKKYKDAGHTEFKSYRYRLVLNGDHTELLSESAKLRNAFQEFHMTLSGPDEGALAAIMSISYW